MRAKLVSLFQSDAADVLEEQSPRGGRLIVYTAGLFLAAFVAWAAWFEIDEVARGDGKVVPSGNVQLVNAMDGGVVAERMVREGDRVRRDQPLLRIEDVRAESQRGESLKKQLALDAKAARLLAEAEGRPAPVFDPALRAALPEAVEREAMLFDARRREHAAQLKVFDGQIAQRIAEAQESRARRDASAGQLTLMQREYDVSRPLARTGAVSEIDLVRLERDLVRVRGDIATAEAAIERLEAGRGEIGQRRREAEETFRAKARQDLAEAAGEAARLREAVRGLDDHVSKTVLRAPVDGIVKVVHARSEGTVLPAGKEAVEIVPADDALLVEVRIQPKDAARLHPGQPATVRLTAWDFAVYGGVPGIVDYVSPDSIVDEKGNAWFVVRVRTERAALERADVARMISPGMTASVDVLTGRRTVLTYLLKPLIRARQAALGER